MNTLPPGQQPHHFLATLHPDLIAPVMGHADTRMVERVYGRLPLQDLEQRLAEALKTAARSV
jgi:hypothetical protein